MDEIKAEVYAMAETESKEAEIYKKMIDKLYKHFVVNDGEAKVDTIIALASALAPIVFADKHEKDIHKTNIEETI